MYDITKTRMLLTTAVFAAVAALCTSGANARIPADSGSASGAQESLRIGAYTAQPPSWQGKGGKGEETGGATNPLQRTGDVKSEGWREWRRGSSKRPSRRADAALLAAGVAGVVLTTRRRGGVALP